MSGGGIRWFCGMWSYGPPWVRFIDWVLDRHSMYVCSKVRGHHRLYAGQPLPKPVQDAQHFHRYTFNRYFPRVPSRRDRWQARRLYRIWHGAAPKTTRPR
jgi:hypothetical protein